ncbi:MAG: chemotaxis protein CheD [Euryarchaeota archaeon]|nr:chemotaxis protein CheD [Euryarchaeota archaeon]
MRRNVGIGEYVVAKSPAVLVSLGLGSCVGVAMYDPVSRVGGLAHVMLPSINGTARVANPGKYADAAIKLMLEEMVRKGAARERIVAKIAGGATMFRNCTSSIGERNVESVREVLKREGIRIVGEDTGRDYGRSIEFDLSTGELLVRSFRHGRRVL